MEEQRGLYPEEQMQIEKVAIKAFLFASDFGEDGVNHLINELKGLKERLEDYERE
jgi:hypothetical protein